ncbi:DUF3603 family protein [Sporolactobacillus vineae]|uniref:DUF3603 family protein n=1 Tax=Sporolactobacillus vineae TaxID=444463 RepID=UPI00028865EF|nr:DUF3603 family protein [Sporolactobacillus vineae]
MEIISDIWVNWFEGEENGFNVCEFHEWRKHDFIELLDQVPFIKVEKPFLSYIENHLLELPEEFLKPIRNKSMISKNNQRETIEYCFVVTDGVTCLAADTLGYRIPVRKSRLIPRQENILLDRAAAMAVERVAVPEVTGKQADRLLSLAAAQMLGLTRRERQVKQLLFMALDRLQATGCAEELRYWYTEWYPEKYQISRSIDPDKAFKEMAMDMKQGWSEKHEGICERLIKGQPYFEKMWEMEHGPKVQ